MRIRLYKIITYAQLDTWSRGTKRTQTNPISAPKRLLCELQTVLSRSYTKAYANAPQSQKQSQTKPILTPAGQSPAPPASRAAFFLLACSRSSIRLAFVLSRGLATRWHSTVTPKAVPQAQNIELRLLKLTLPCFKKADNLSTWQAGCRCSLTGAEPNTLKTEDWFGAMARTRGKKALYEVISQTRPKSGTPPAQPPEQQEKPRETKCVVPGDEMPETPVQWPTKPRMVQLNAGRIEMSLPYQLAVALLLGVIVLLLVFYRLGQISYAGRQDTPAPGDSVPKTAPLAKADDAKPRVAPGERTTEQGPAAEQTGDHVVVLVEYGRLADLVPVQQHFSEHGIGTEIMQQGGRYLLVTKKLYENPEKQGTDGYVAKQEIIRVGRLYKGRAPEGYETFAPNYFGDAYGRKVK